MGSYKDSKEVLWELTCGGTGREECLRLGVSIIVYSDDEGCGTLAYLKVGTDKILNLTNLFF